MEKDFEKMAAVAEWTLAFEFLCYLGKLPTKQMLKEIEVVDPSFIQHEKELGGPRHFHMSWHECYFLSVYRNFKEKYPTIWRDVTRAFAYAHKHSPYKHHLSAKVISQLEEIFKQSDFYEE